jgi:hypothetical protein
MSKEVVVAFIRLLSLNLPGRTEENYKRPGATRSPGQDLTWELTNMKRVCKPVDSNIQENLFQLSTFNKDFLLRYNF